MTNTLTDLELIAKAHVFALAKHATQVRKYDGEPYVNHCRRVAALVEKHGAPAHVVAAALLHDTLEDTNTTVTELLHTFGDAVTKLVLELTDVFVPGTLENGKGLNRAARKAKEADRLAAASEFAHWIKVADLVDNTESIMRHDAAGFGRIYLAEKRALLPRLTKAPPMLRHLAVCEMEKANA